MQPRGSLSNAPLQMEEPPEWTVIVAKLIEYEVFSRSNGDRIDEERWVWTCNHELGTCYHGTAYQPPPPHLEPRWLDPAKLSSVVRDSLLPQTIDVILNNKLLISFIIFLVITYSRIIATFLEELQRRRLEHQLKHSYEPPAANSSEAPKPFMDWRPSPSRAHQPPQKPSWRHRIFSANGNVQLANDNYTYKREGEMKGVGVIQGPKRKSCEFPGAYALDEFDSVGDTEVSMPTEPRDHSHCSAPPLAKYVLSGSAACYRSPSRPAAPQSGRANISSRTAGHIDALNTMHAGIMRDGEARSKVYQDISRCQTSLPFLPANPLPVHNVSAPAPTCSGIYDGTIHSREVQSTRKKPQPVQVVNTMKRSERSALVGPYTRAPRPTPRPSFRCPDSVEPESRQGFTPAPTRTRPHSLAPLATAVPSPSPVPVPRPAFVRPLTHIPVPAVIVEHINPRKRRRITRSVENEPEQGEPPRKVRKGPNGDPISTHFHKNQVPPLSIVDDTAKIEVKDILGIRAIYVDANGKPDYRNPSRSRKDGEEWSGRIWKMRMTDGYRERLCDINCVYTRSLRSPQNNSAHLHAWLTDEHYCKTIIHENFRSWKVTSVQPVLPGAPVDEWLLKEGQKFARGWSVPESPHDKESAIPTKSDPSTSAPSSLEHLPCTPPQPRPLDEKETPPTKVVEVDEEQIATLDTADDHTAERVDSIANDSMDVDDDPTDAMDLCSSPLLPPINRLPLHSSQGNTQLDPNLLGTSFTSHSAFVSPAAVVAQRESHSSNVAVPSRPAKAIAVSSQPLTQPQNSAKNWPPFTFDLSSNLFKLPTHPGDKKPVTRRPHGAKSRPHMLSGGRNLSKGTPLGPNLPSSSSFGNVSSTHPALASVTLAAPQTTAPSFFIAPNLPGAQATMTPPQASSFASLTPGQTGPQSALSLNDTNSGFTASPSGTGVLGRAMFTSGKLPLVPLASGNSGNVSGCDVGTSDRAKYLKNTTPPPLVGGERQIRPARKSWRNPPFDATHTVSTDPHLAGFGAPGTSYSAQDTPATSFASQFPLAGPQAPVFNQRQFLEEQWHEQEVHGGQNQLSQHEVEGYKHRYERGLGGDFTNI